MDLIIIISLKCNLFSPWYSWKIDPWYYSAITHSYGSSQYLFYGNNMYLSYDYCQYFSEGNSQPSHIICEVLSYVFTHNCHVWLHNLVIYVFTIELSFMCYFMYSQINVMCDYTT
jgi:hypothetical protein